MTISIAVAAGFAVWTILTLLGSVGVYRWSRILRGRAQLTDFPAEQPEGADWYRRAMRAHANCIENLPVYCAIVIAIVASGIEGPVLDNLAIIFLTARISQTLIHILAAESNSTIACRFGFYLIQIVCMLAMFSIVVVTAL